MIRTALLYGLWAAFCLAATALAILGPDLFRGMIPSWPTIALLLRFIGATPIVAALGWMLFHHQGRRPSVPGYGLLGILVVLVTQAAVLGVEALLTGWQGNFISTFGVFLAMHGWLTVPVALIGTALFVRWNNRRRLTA